MDEVGLPEFQDAYARAFPDGTMAVWLHEHYELRQRTRIPSDGFDKVCKRCGMADIYAVLTHAHNVHGDDVPVATHVAHLVDEQGRYVGGELDQLRAEVADLKRQLAFQ